MDAAHGLLEGLDVGLFHGVDFVFVPTARV